MILICASSRRLVKAIACHVFINNQFSCCCVKITWVVMTMACGKNNIMLDWTHNQGELIEWKVTQMCCDQEKWVRKICLYLYMETQSQFWWGFQLNIEYIALKMKHTIRCNGLWQKQNYVGLTTRVSQTKWKVTQMCCDQAKWVGGKNACIYGNAKSILTGLLTEYIALKMNYIQ